MKAFARVWHLAGNIYLTMAIIGMMAADLVWGYIKLKEKIWHYSSPSTTGDF